jgi:hypothetical protein
MWEELLIYIRILMFQETIDNLRDLVFKNNRYRTEIILFHLWEGLRTFYKCGFVIVYAAISSGVFYLWYT